MSEYHVCGVVLMSRPERVADVEATLRDMPGVGLHANDGGRMVVTVEGTAYGECADIMNTLVMLKGVASSSLVYHQVDNEFEPEELLQ